MAELTRYTAEVFVRLLREECEEDPDQRYAFFIGAGCSVSSGIPDSATLVRDVWLPRLRRRIAPEQADMEEWAARAFPNYDPANPSLIYGDLIKRLFHQAKKRQQEFERLCKDRYPVIGYATLAKLMTIYGGRFNVVLTTNFDDLLQDALYLYTDVRPLVIYHESLAGYIRPTQTRPLVVKLHGDNHLSPYNTIEETARLGDEFRNPIKFILHDRGLIFVGYGGNDKSIIRLLETLPDGALQYGVYWVSNREPQGEIRSWLESREAILVENNDFDRLMVLIKKEFNLPFPDVSRFVQVFDNCRKMCERLLSEAASLPENDPFVLALKAELDSWDEEAYKKLLADISAFSSTKDK